MAARTLKDDARPPLMMPVASRLLRFLPLAFATVLHAAPSAAPVWEASGAAETASEASAARLSIERVSFTRRSDGMGYVVRIHSSEPIGAYSMEQAEDGSVEVVVFQARLARGFRRGSARGPVRSYRVSSARDRVTLRFAVRDAVRAQAYPDRESDDLLLSLTRAPAAPVTPAPATSAPTASGASPSTVGDTNWRLDTIVLDAGHGGSDHGAVANGTSDKAVALGVVLRLGEMIEEELGVNVVYTRTRDDEFHALRERGRIANRAGGKLFISVHANAAASSRARGTETFFLAPHKSESAREVMERENSVIQLESDPSLYADFDDEGGILRSMAMSAYQEESQLLATLVEREFVASGRRSRGVKQAPFLVLWAASMPAVLVETGFITNREEARFLASSRGQEKTARAIFEAVKKYKERYERGLRLAADG